MAKIESLGDKYLYKRSESKKSQKNTGAGTSRFPQIVHSVSGSEFIDDKLPEEQRNKALEDLVDEVHKAGEKLKNAPLMDNIRDYKKAIRDFLQFVTKYMFGVEEKQSGFGIKKRKKYTLVKVIDRKLEDLTLEILRTQGQHLDILKRIDEINGLVVDLVR
jgi:uncharacterized protein YaaR (DUF327 family)